MQVIAISAKARHGKDTTAEILKELYEAKGKRVLITHFADLLKYICTKFFNWDGQKNEAGRTLLQQIGTNTIGRKYPDFWVNFIINILEIFKDTWDIVLIPDCRFPIEVEQLKRNFDTKVLRIVRPNFDNDLTETQKQHPSEIALDNYNFDFIIENNSSILDLKTKLKNYIDNIE